MRRRLLLAADLLWVAVSPVAALLIREGWPMRPGGLLTALVLGLVGVGVGAVVFPLAGLNRTLWRYTSLHEVLRLLMAVTITLVLSVFVGFAIWRLEDVSRSLPVIQWFFLVGAMVGTRIAVRIWRERAKLVSETETASDSSASHEHVLIVGVGPLAELYLRSAAELAPNRILVEGILATGDELKGRILRSHEVLGSPHDVERVARDLEVRGISLGQIIVAELASRLDRRSREALLNFESASDVKVRWLADILGFEAASPSAERLQSTRGDAAPSQSEFGPKIASRPLKRAFDVLGSAMLIASLSPVILLVASVIAMDVGFPIIFWQKRPGRHGHPFKLYKFRTMRAAHDANGMRIPDEARSSTIGRYLRRSRLDELPQLYNILVGEMSFVGPRPLLRVEQQSLQGSLRLLARPGLTGWAQVNGGRMLSAEDKIPLDDWYIQNQSLVLDLQILFRTIAFLMRGDHIKDTVGSAPAKLPPRHDPSPSVFGSGNRRAG